MTSVREGLHRCLLVSVSITIAVFLAVVPAAAADIRLIMVERDGCRYCVDWHREIGPGYPKSAEGKFAPLHRVQQRDAEQLKTFAPVIYTPTFLVVSGTTELGRVTGYSGQMFFYEELDEQLVKAGFKPDWGIPEVGDQTQIDNPAQSRVATAGGER